LETILTNVRGGALERVDFHDHQRRCAGVFFVAPEEAIKFIIFRKAQGL
jgi:hypothetical protein